MRILKISRIFLIIPQIPRAVKRNGGIFAKQESNSAVCLTQTKKPLLKFGKNFTHKTYSPTSIFQLFTLVHPFFLKNLKKILKKFNNCDALLKNITIFVLENKIE